MMRLGEILVQRGACDGQRVREALETQVLLGGRLGTNLLELNAVKEEHLAGALYQQHGVPTRFGEIDLDPKVVALLKPEQVERLEVVPYQLSGRRLAVLCCDPRDLRRLDEVAFATGKEVVPVVVPEARLWWLLRRHYHLERSLRGIDFDWNDRPGAISLEPEAPLEQTAAADLITEEEFATLYADKLNVTTPPVLLRPEASRAPAPPAQERAPAAWPPVPAPLATRPPPAVAAKGPRAPPAPSRAAPRPPPTPPPVRSLQSIQSLDEPFAGTLETSDEVLASLQAEATAARPSSHDAITFGDAPAPQPLSFQEAAAALAGVADRSAIARIVLRYALSHFRRALLLTVHARGADGWEGIGEGLTPQTVARVHVQLGPPGVLQTVVESRSHYLGSLPRTEANIRLLRALAGGAPKSSFVMPILARGRVVNVLYADDGRGRMVNPDGVGELLILAAKISQSYDVLLGRTR